MHTGYSDRGLIKKLRRVPLEYFCDPEARNVCNLLCKGEAVLSPLRGTHGEELTPLDSTEMDSAIRSISENHLMRESLKYSSRLSSAARNSDINTVTSLLKTRPTATGGHEAPTLDQIIPELVSEITSSNGAGSYPKLAGEHGRKITLAPGSVTVIAGGTGGGKTAYAEDMALELAKAGVSVVDYSLELQPNVKLARYCQHISGPAVGPEALFNGNYNASMLQTTLHELKSLPIKIECNKMNITDLLDSIRQEAEMGARVMIIDFIQLVQDPRFESDYARITNVALELYALAKEVGVAMVWLAQLNREGRKGTLPPRKEDIEGSGKIEQLAWTVLLLCPQDEQNRSAVSTSVSGTAAPAPVSRPFKVIFDKVRLGEKAAYDATYTGAYLEFDVNKTKLRRGQPNPLGLI